MEIIRDGNIGYLYHAQPRVLNIGDALCSPRLYLEFSCDPENSTLIVGGGAIGDGRSLFADSGHRHRVVWGVGQSTPLVPPAVPAVRRPAPSLLRRAARRLVRLAGGGPAASVQTAPAVPEGIVLSSTRDPDRANANESLVPCVSCFHPIASASRGKGIAVVLNANPDVSGDVEAVFAALCAEHPDVRFATNALSEAELLELFNTCGRVITNSYHFTYWSLLSGGAVQVIGYSSKSGSVLELFGLDRDRMGRYRRGDGDGLLAALRQALRSPDWTSLPDAEVARARCRDLNLAFARKAAQTVPSLEIALKPRPPAPGS